MDLSIFVCKYICVYPSNKRIPSSLSRHSDSKSSAKERKGFLAVEEDMSDVYPLQLRLAVICETNALSVKISKKVRDF